MNLLSLLNISLVCNICENSIERIRNINSTYLELGYLIIKPKGVILSKALDSTLSLIKPKIENKSSKEICSMINICPKKKIQ